MRYILDLHVVNHSFPTRLSSGVAQLELAPGVRDVFWFDENGDDLPEVHWNNPNARLLGLRRAAPMADDDGKTIEAVIALFNADGDAYNRSDEHTSEVQSLMSISYAVSVLKIKQKLHRCNI